MNTYWTSLSSPVGELLLVGRETSVLQAVWWAGGRHVPARDPGWQQDRGPLAEAVAQLEQYFAGERATFELKSAPPGTAFQHAVWGALTEIGYAATESYAGLAARLGNPAAVRAVGLANGRNPLSIVVPCHRVIGADGSLTGYGGGLAAKQWLLEHEARHAAGLGFAAQTLF